MPSFEQLRGMKDMRENGGVSIDSNFNLKVVYEAFVDADLIRPRCLMPYDHQ